MNRLTRVGFTLVAILAAGGGGYWAGHRDLALASLSWLRAASSLEDSAAASARGGNAQSGPVVYYRDPDGQPFYSMMPKKTTDGRNYWPVYATQDLSFEDQPEAVATPSSGSAKRILYYRNPMGLPDTSPTPKKDSMGMDYIAVYEGDDDGSSVKVAAGKLQRTGVRTEIVSRRTIVNPIRVPGTVQLDEKRVTVIATRSDAFINKVADVTTGDRVSKGQPLLQLYSPEIAAAGAQFLTNIGNRGNDDALSGARQRLENLGASAETIAEIERSRKVPLSMTWRAPRGGVVLQRNAVEGMKASSGDVLFRLADISVVWVLADVPEYQLGSVEVGETATIRLRSRPGQTLTGRISLIYPQVAPETRTTKVRIEISNPDGILLPDMYADVEISSGRGNAVVAVPDNAVIDTGTRQLVIVDKGDGRFEPRKVSVGQQGSGFIEVRSGLATGEKVVVAANFLIDAESNLKSALSGMTDAETTP